jgi:hypothetical protein
VGQALAEVPGAALVLERLCVDELGRELNAVIARRAN